ncbi:MAG TPA: hypothetical protein VFP84_23580, partial [Kofleriaceae bacterium]|nr:hypothetical protein [Kofleriaceae bacterium]
LTRHTVAGVAITAPASWPNAPGPARTPPDPFAPAGVVSQPDGFFEIKLARVALANPTQQIAAWIASEGRQAKLDYGEVGPSASRLVALPAGWSGVELTAQIEDELDYRQRVRVILCGRAFGDQLVVMAIEVPETVASAAPGFVVALIAATGPA